MRVWAIPLLAALFVGPLAHAENVDLFVVAGQSNALGWAGDAAWYPPDPHQLDETIRFYWDTPGRSSSGGEWLALQPQGGIFPKGHFGPEVTLARSLKTAGYNPAIFKYSRGSSSLAVEWGAPGSGKMYDEMVNELRHARSVLEQQGDRVTLRGFVWIQGESDAGTPEMAEAYEGRLNVMLDDFRKKVARNAALPVVLGVDEQHPMVQVNPQVVDAQMHLAARNRHTVFSSMFGLEKEDSTHLTPAGLAVHGKRLYQAYATLNRAPHVANAGRAMVPQN